LRLRGRTILILLSGQWISDILALRPRSEEAMRRAVVFLSSLLVAVGVLAPAPNAAAARVSCSSSKALFANPLGDGVVHRSVVGLQLFHRGTWYGFAASDMGVFDLISWRPGRRVHVVHRVEFRNGPNLPYTHGSIDPVGVTPSGDLVAAIQRVTAHGRDADYVKRLFVWHHGVGRSLRGRWNVWREFGPLGMTPSGAVLAYARSMHAGKPVYRIYRWARTDAAPTLLITLVNTSTPVADGQGDVAWQAWNGMTAVRVRLADGRIRNLHDDHGGANDLTVYHGAGHVLYGAGAGHGARWDLAAAAPTGPITAQPLPWLRSTTVFAANGTDTVVFGGNRRFVKIGSAPRVTVPVYTAMGPVGEAVSPSGVVAYTGRDRLAHLLTCRSV
jgi:hypothetical protein